MLMKRLHLFILLFSGCIILGHAGNKAPRSFKSLGLESITITIYRLDTKHFTGNLHVQISLSRKKRFKPWFALTGRYRIKMNQQQLVGNVQYGGKLSLSTLFLKQLEKTLLKSPNERCTKRIRIHASYGDNSFLFNKSLCLSKEQFRRSVFGILYKKAEIEKQAIFSSRLTEKIAAFVLKQQSKIQDNISYGQFPRNLWKFQYGLTNHQINYQYGMLLSRIRVNSHQTFACPRASEKIEDSNEDRNVSSVNKRTIKTNRCYYIDIYPGGVLFNYKILVKLNRNHQIIDLKLFSIVNKT